jgi:GNAT superfamily N-acetyltransferase
LSFIRVAVSKLIRLMTHENLNDILYVINESNRQAYRSIIPNEYFREPVLTHEELVDWMNKAEFYGYFKRKRITAVASLRIEDDDTARIGWVYVLPEFQRKGIGTALIHHLEGIARRKGLKKARLLTVSGAYWATKFYEKLGYQLAEKIARPWGFDQYMEKKLI